MSWLPPSDGRLPITDTVALSYEIGWLRHRRIFTQGTGSNLTKAPECLITINAFRCFLCSISGKRADIYGIYFIPHWEIA